MDSVTNRVRAVLHGLGPALSVDGGGVELDLVEGDTAHIRLTGACIGCPGREITLKYGVESAVTEAVAEISRVVTVD